MHFVQLLSKNTGQVNVLFIVAMKIMAKGRERASCIHVSLPTNHQRCSSPGWECKTASVYGEMWQVSKEESTLGVGTYFLKTGILQQNHLWPCHWPSNPVCAQP